MGADVSNRDKTIEDLKSSSCDSSEQLETLKADINKQIQDLEVLKDEKSHLNQKVQKLQVEIDELKNKHVKESEKVKLDYDIADITGKLNSMKEEVEELSLSKKELNDQLKKSNDSSKLALQEMKTEKETLTVQHESEVSTLNNELQILRDQVIEKDERYESLNWKKGELEK